MDDTEKLIWGCIGGLVVGLVGATIRYVSKYFAEKSRDRVVLGSDLSISGDRLFHRCLKAITGRAGLFPSRYQSDDVDRPNGPLVNLANRRLRTAILMIADNLRCCNHHFRALGQIWKIAGKDPRHSHVKIASRFCRIAFQMVAGRQVFQHRSHQRRDYILEKLIAFHTCHETTTKQLMRDIDMAVAQLPGKEYQAEAEPLTQQLAKIQGRRSRRASSIGEILPVVLAKLGVQRIESSTSGDD